MLQVPTVYITDHKNVLDALYSILSKTFLTLGEFLFSVTRFSLEM